MSLSATWATATPSLKHGRYVSFLFFKSVFFHCAYLASVLSRSVQRSPVTSNRVNDWRTSPGGYGTYKTSWSRATMQSQNANSASFPRSWAINWTKRRAGQYNHYYSIFFSFLFPFAFLGFSKKRSFFKTGNYPQPITTISHTPLPPSYSSSSHRTHDQRNANRSIHFFCYPAPT